jgi:thiamine biosynthesis protein ThiS
VTVNGSRRALPAGCTVATLLAGHGLDPRLVVVEHNREILRDRDAFGSIALGDGDVVELVHFVGGG